MSVSQKDITQDRDSARWLYPRLRAFAIALTGSLRAGAGLAQAAMAELKAGPEAEAGRAGVLLSGYRAAHALWQARVAEQSGDSVTRADPRCFALPADTPAAAAQHRGLAQVIASLPAQQRATLLLIYGEGLAYDEVAEVFDTTVQVVMTRAVRGHVAIEHWLHQRDGGGTAPDDRYAEAGDAIAARETAGEVA